MTRKDRTSVRLDESIQEYFKELESVRLAQTTLASKRRTLEMLTLAVGRKNRATRKLTDQDFTRCRTLLTTGLSDEENEARRRKGLTPRTGRSHRAQEGDRATLNQFVELLVKRGWVAPNFNPMWEIAKAAKDNSDKPAAKTRRRRNVPLAEWPALLEAAGRHHPRTRMIVAAGLGWGRRSSEIAHVKWQHIRDGEVEFFNIKRGRPVSSGGMVISPWVQAELDRWKAWVEAAHGPVQPEWPVLSVKLSVYEPAVENILDTVSWPVDPTRHMTAVAVTEDIRSALERHGWTEAMMYGEGGHTLRRSWAIVVEENGGVEAAQAGLDHESASMTQHYTGNRAGHRAMNTFLAGWSGPTAEAKPEPEPAKVPEPEPEVASNVVDFAAWRARKAG